VWKSRIGTGTRLSGIGRKESSVSFQSPDKQDLFPRPRASTAEDRGCGHWPGNLARSGNADFIWCVAFSPDGKRLASGSGLKRLDTSRRHEIWDPTTEQGGIDHPGTSRSSYVRGVRSSRSRLATASSEVGQGLENDHRRESAHAQGAHRAVRRCRFQSRWQRHGATGALLRRSGLGATTGQEMPASKGTTWRQWRGP